MAKLVRRLTLDQEIVGSSPTSPATCISLASVASRPLHRANLWRLPGLGSQELLLQRVGEPVLESLGARSILGAVKPDLAGMIEAGIVTDSTDMTFEPTALRATFPELEPTRMAQVVELRCRAAGRL